MGSIMGAIRDDIADYEELCRFYGEPVQYSLGSPDCYGEHAGRLERRRKEERRKKVKEEPVYSGHVRAEDREEEPKMKDVERVDFSPREKCGNVICPNRVDQGAFSLVTIGGKEEPRYGTRPLILFLCAPCASLLKGD